MENTKTQLLMEAVKVKGTCYLVSAVALLKKVPFLDNNDMAEIHKLIDSLEKFAESR